ncbi:ABC transporter substrate-binding protein [Nocardioides montaniterrae]
MRKFMKRMVPAIVVATAATAGLAGCGSNNNHEAAGPVKLSNGQQVTLTILYRPDSAASKKGFENLQQQLSQVGLKVKGLPASQSDFYAKYLTQGDSAKAGDWDITLAGWGPDWYGNGAASFFLPLFYGKKAFPPAGSNFGFYDSPKTNALIAKANGTDSNAEALKLWAQADRQVMEDAPFVPLTDPVNPNYHSKNISNAITIPAFQQYDPTNLVKTGANSDTLNLLGISDIEWMDPTASYYSQDYVNLRMINRQLYSYPAIAGKTTTVAPDIATGMPQISKDGKTVTVHMRSGVMWNSKPARPVVAGDVVRDVERSCNPVQPFGGSADYADLLDGYNDYCAAFAKAAGDKPTPASLTKAMESTPFKAVTAPNDSTVVYHLTHASPYFTDMLTLPALSTPVPEEYNNYLPGTGVNQHTLSNGPYQVAEYKPAKSIVYEQNPVWKQSTDPIRKQNFKKIVANETGDQGDILKKLQTGSPDYDSFWDTFPLGTEVPGLQAKGDKNLDLTPTSSSNPYIVFNTISPNNDGAMKDPAFRRALSYAINRAEMLKAMGPSMLYPPLTHVLPKEIDGSKDFDLYPFSQAKAESALADFFKK